MIRFDVIDTKIGKYPDIENIALIEDWAKKFDVLRYGRISHRRGRNSMSC